MDERQTGDGAHLQAAARDIGQARDDDALDRQALQLPRGPPELLGGPEGAFGEQDDLGGQVFDNGCGGISVSDDGDAGHGLRRAARRAQ